MGQWQQAVLQTSLCSHVCILHGWLYAMCLMAGHNGRPVTQNQLKESERGKGGGGTEGNDGRRKEMEWPSLGDGTGKPRQLKTFDWPNTTWWVPEYYTRACNVTGHRSGAIAGCNQAPELLAAFIALNAGMEVNYRDLWNIWLTEEGKSMSAPPGTGWCRHEGND